MSFREEFLKFKQPSSQREDFVFDSIKRYVSKDSILQSLQPISVDKNGFKVTYYVMPDYLSIDNVRLPMSGKTAQKVADYFGLLLPSPEISREIYNNSDIKFSANPLSNSGATINGKKYTGKQVVDKGVGYADFALIYNENINKDIFNRNVKKNQIIYGFAKDITSPIIGHENKLGLYGFYDKKGKPIQGGSGRTPHNIDTHTEYGAFVRLIHPKAEVMYKDGKSEKKDISSIYNVSSYTKGKDNNTKITDNSYDDIINKDIISILNDIKIAYMCRRFNILKRSSILIKE